MLPEEADITAVSMSSSSSKSLNDFAGGNVASVGGQQLTIAHGCLLLPVGMAFWWYWMRRKARRALKLMLPPSELCGGLGAEVPSYDEDDGCCATANGFEGSEKDYINTWEELMQEHDSKDNATRLVRWIKGVEQDKNDERTVRNATRKNLRQLEVSTRSDVDPKSEPFLTTASEDQVVVSTGKLVGQWQYIEEITGFELLEISKSGRDLVDAACA